MGRLLYNISFSVILYADIGGEGEGGGGRVWGGMGKGWEWRDTWKISSDESQLERFYRNSTMCH